MNKRWLVVMFCMAIGSASCMQARMRSNNRMNPTEIKLDQLSMQREQVMQEIATLEQQMKTAEMQCEQTQGYAKGEVCDFSVEEIRSKTIERDIAKRKLEKIEKDIAALHKQMPAK